MPLLDEQGEGVRFLAQARTRSLPSETDFGHGFYLVKLGISLDDDDTDQAIPLPGMEALCRR
jgi:hypothetical protein